jgi:hypothetical protein
MTSLVHNGLLPALTAVLLAAVPAMAENLFKPDFCVHPDDYTVLVAHDAQIPEGLKRLQAGGHGKFQVDGWTRPDQALVWEVTVPDDDAYAVSVLVCRNDGRPLELTVSCAGGTLSGKLQAAARTWTRQALDGTLHLPKGKQTISLRAQPSDNSKEFAASVFSIELVRPAVRDRLHAAAVKLRADTTWLQKAGFGLMSHWTSQSCPRRGEPKPYTQAARDFDVETLANQVQDTGAGFFVLTTSHAQFYFPAPIKAIDGIIPDRTAQRDLVADLAGALGKRGIRLMLYYHIGAVSDPEWLKVSGFWETGTSRIFGNWTAIIGEVGQRYGDRLAGWWFDDGAINYYYRSAPWERLTRAAKAGNPQRLVGYNPWVFPSPTEFQDFCCGEGFGDPGAGGLLPVGGDGRYMAGTYQGLQACATLITEGDWVHDRKSTEIGKPHWSAEQLATLLDTFAKFRNVPIFNLEIYQEGTVSPTSVGVFKQARRLRLERKP